MHAKEDRVLPIDYPVWMHPMSNRQRFHAECTPVQRREEDMMASGTSVDRDGLERFHGDRWGEEARDGQNVEEGIFKSSRATRSSTATSEPKTFLMCKPSRLRMPE